MSNTHHLQQVRAAKAFEFATGGNEKQSPTFNYSAAVQELATLIKTNGLANTLAYCYAKEGAPRLLFDQIREWLTKPESPVTLIVKGDEATGFMQAILHLDNDNYRMAQQEALLLAGWLVRFVKKPESTNQPSEQNATR